MGQKNYLTREDGTLEFIDTFAADWSGPPRHFHPEQTERFTVLQGIIVVEHPSGATRLFEGERYAIAPCEPHTVHTRGLARAIVKIEIEPAGDMESFFRGIGMCARTGLNPLLQIAVTHSAARSAPFYFAGVPVALQKAAFAGLTPIGWLMGYRAISPDGRTADG